MQKQLIIILAMGLLVSACGGPNGSNELDAQANTESSALTGWGSPEITKAVLTMQDSFFSQYEPGSMEINLDISFIDRTKNETDFEVRLDYSDSCKIMENFSRNPLYSSIGFRFEGMSKQKVGQEVSTTIKEWTTVGMINPGDFNGKTYYYLAFEDPECDISVTVEPFCYNDSSCERAEFFASKPVKATRLFVK